MKNSLSCHKHIDPSNPGNLYRFYLFSFSDKKMLNLIFSPNFGIFMYNWGLKCYPFPRISVGFWDIHFHVVQVTERQLHRRPSTDEMSFTIGRKMWKVFVAVICEASNEISIFFLALKLFTYWDLTSCEEGRHAPTVHFAQLLSGLLCRRIYLLIDIVLTVPFPAAVKGLPFGHRFALMTYLLSESCNISQGLPQMAPGALWGD